MGMEPEEPAVSGLRCRRCQRELWVGEIFGRFRDREVCVDCAEDEWREMTVEERLMILGYEVTVA